MDTKLLDRCELLLRNRAAMRVAFPWDTGMIHLCCASMYTLRGLEADPTALRSALTILQQNTGVFSEFRGTARNVLLCMMDLSGDPQDMVRRATDVYALLKQEFFASAYLPVAAMTLVEQVDPFRYAETVRRTRALYDRMKKEHPFLTSAEDVTFCALLALSPETDDVLLDRMERAYALLKPHFFYSEAVQALTHVLTLLPGDIGQKCARVVECAEAFKAAGNRWGRDHELPVLGVLCEDPRPLDDLVRDAVACSDHLKGKKGFGFFSTVDRPMRLMYAGLLTRQADPTASAAAVNSTLSAVIAQQTAITCCVICSTSATASASHQ